MPYSMYSVRNLGVPPLFWVKRKTEMTEGRKGSRLSKLTAPTPVAQGLDPPLLLSYSRKVNPYTRIPSLHFKSRGLKLVHFATS